MDHADFAFLEELEKDPKWAQIICEGFGKLCRGYWDPHYVALIMDRWGSSFTFGDVYCFIKVHALLASGRALMTRIEVGEPPFGDKYAKENNDLLKSLPSPFSAKFEGGSGDDDGYVEWLEPIEANSILKGGVEKQATILPGRAALEVGHTNAFTTLRHLNFSARLARWPYHSADITIIHMVDVPGIAAT